MAIKAHLESSAPGEGQRATPRRALRLETSGMLAGGQSANVTIHNISASGLLIESELGLERLDEMVIDMPEVGKVTARIMWRSERLYGCAFIEPLNNAALAAAQLQGMPVGEAVVTGGAVAVPRTLAGDTLGMRINRLRREAGLTLADVAARLSVSKPTVWAWEKGKARPLPERMEAIAAALDAAPEDLVEPGAAEGNIGVLIEDCRARIAQACGTAPDAVRIMIEL